MFGSLCFPWLRPYATNKLDNRLLPCTFLGYSLTQSTYLCLDAATGRIYTSRHVQFVELQFPFATPLPPMGQEPGTPSSFVYSPYTLIPVTPPPLVQPPSPAPPSSDPHLTPSLTRSSSVSAPSEQSSEMGPRNNSPDPLNDTQAHTETSPSPSPNPQPTSSQSTSSISSSSSTPTPPLQESPPPPSPTPPPPPPENRHIMTTRAKNNITKPTQRLTLLTTAKTPKPLIPSTVN